MWICLGLVFSGALTCLCATQAKLLFPLTCHSLFLVLDLTLLCSKQRGQGTGISWLFEIAFSFAPPPPGKARCLFSKRLESASLFRVFICAVACPGVRQPQVVLLEEASWLRSGRVGVCCCPSLVS